MKPWLVPLLLFTVALAGCTSSDDGGNTGIGTGGSGAGEQTQIEGIAAPTWQVGDWWTYDNSFGDTFTLVVTEDNGNTWTMDTDSTTLSFVSAIFGEISYLGDIRKSDLAGSQDGAAVTWLQFPLEHGNTWTADWDGQRFDMVSHVTDDIAHIVASIDGTNINSLVYDASVGWFTSISWGDLETGEEYGRIDLSAAGSTFDGEAIRVEPEIVAEGITEGMQTQTFGVFPDGTMETDDGDAFLFLTAACDTGAWEFGVGTFESLVDSNAGTGMYDDQGIIIQSECPTQYVFFDIVSETPGENTDHWGILVGSQSPELYLEYTLYLRHFERITL